MRRSAFRQNHVSDFIERRLDFFLISNTLEESIVKTDIPASFCTDHLPLFFFNAIKIYANSGKKLLGFIWLLKKLLNSRAEYVEKPENQNFQTLPTLDQDKITDKHLKWEYLESEIGKFIKDVSINLVQEENKNRNFLERD